MVSEGAFLELFVPATPEAHCKQLTIFINYVYFYHGGLGLNCVRDGSGVATTKLWNSASFQNNLSRARILSARISTLWKLG